MVNERQKVLIVDDNDAHRELIKASLNSNYDNLTVCEANDSIDAVEMLRESKYDLIILDYMMPWMNGIEFLEITENMRENIPTVMISGSGDHSIMATAFNLGVTDYIPKELNLTESLSKVMRGIFERPQKKHQVAASVTTADDAVKLIRKFQSDMVHVKGKHFHEEVIVIEFNDADEFNRFSRSVLDIKNVRIKDIQILNNRYMVLVSLFPESYEKIM